MTSEPNYSWLDRLFHRVAFCSPAVQLTAADVEAMLHGRSFRALPVERPIFVTSLPRAGTTLLLEVLSRFQGVATHCYRDMPFVLAPLLWDSLSRRHRKAARLRERAHGDGMKVGYDSPEAFEEVLWRMCWPEKFTDEGIALWTGDEPAEEFAAVFVSHMQRLIAVRSKGSAAPRRYCSKNNANIARIGFLKRLFPDALLVVPFRSPLDQARSLLRQHLRFGEMHRRDPFARRYMEDIGHLEFGLLHRRLLFPTTTDTAGPQGPETVEYWVRYWLDAFRHVLRQQESVLLMSYDRLCDGGPPAVQALVERLGICHDPRDFPAGVEIEQRRPYAGDDIDPQLLEQAQTVHRDLLAHSVV